jgi:hypothetical protein
MDFSMGELFQGVPLDQHQKKRVSVRTADREGRLCCGCLGSFSPLHQEVKWPFVVVLSEGECPEVFLSLIGPWTLTTLGRVWPGSWGTTWGYSHSWHPSGDKAEVFGQHTASPRPFILTTACLFYFFFFPLTAYSHSLHPWGDWFQDSCGQQNPWMLKPLMENGVMFACKLPNPMQMLCK